MVRCQASQGVEQGLWETNEKKGDTMQKRRLGNAPPLHAQPGCAVQGRVGTRTVWKVFAKKMTHMQLVDAHPAKSQRREDQALGSC